VERRPGTLKINECALESEKGRGMQDKPLLWEIRSTVVKEYANSSLGLVMSAFRGTGSPRLERKRGLKKDVKGTEKHEHWKEKR